MKTDDENQHDEKAFEVLQMVKLEWGDELPEDIESIILSAMYAYEQLPSGRGRKKTSELRGAVSEIVRASKKLSQRQRKEAQWQASDIRLNAAPDNEGGMGSSTEHKPYLPSNGVVESLHLLRSEFIEEDLGRRTALRELRNQIAIIGWLPDGATWDEWEMIEFMESPITQHLSFSQLECIRQEFGRPLRYLTWQFQPTRIRKRQRLIKLSGDATHGRWEKAYILPDANVRAIIYREGAPPRFHWGDIREASIKSKWVGPISQPEAVFETYEETIYPPDPNQTFEVGNVKIGYPNTPVGEILRISAHIAREYSFQVGDVVQFIISGKFPRRNLIEEQFTTCPVHNDDGELEYYGFGPVRLSVHLWTPVDDLVRWFKALQNIAYVQNDPTHPRNIFRERAISQSMEAQKNNRVIHLDEIPEPEYKDEKRYCLPDQQTVELVRFRLGRKKLVESYTSTLRAFYQYVSDMNPAWRKGVPISSRSVVPNSIQRIRKLLFPYHRVKSSRSSWRKAITHAIHIETLRQTGMQRRGRKHSSQGTADLGE